MKEDELIKVTARLGLYCEVIGDLGEKMPEAVLNELKLRFKKESKIVLDNLSDIFKNEE